MKVCVYGLWHLGSVISASLAALGHDVFATDHDSQAVLALIDGKLPVQEPGLLETIHQGRKAGRLRYVPQVRDAVGDADVLWITLDTPVDELDRPDHAFVKAQVLKSLPFAKEGAVVLVSSQVPVGWTHELAAAHFRAGGRRLIFGYSPENLRLGSGLDTFQRAERFVIGIDDDAARPILAELFQPLPGEKIWMSIRSAEMTKHALNAFLALSISFINEIATLCESSGADARDVEKGLKSDRRIGPRAYLRAGGPFGGGTLARDLRVLGELAERHHFSAAILSAILASNERHKSWTNERLNRLLPDLSDKRIAILGLAYKPGTDAVRRSYAIDLCRQLGDRGAQIRGYDPLVTQFPPPAPKDIVISSSLEAVLSGADAAVLVTPSDGVRALSPERLKELMRRPLVLDPNRHLEGLADASGVEYVSVGFEGAMSR